MLMELGKSEKTNPFSIDDMIAKEIYELEKELNKGNKINLTNSIDVSIQKSIDSSQTFENNPLFGYSNPRHSKDYRSSADYFKTSSDTLGSTGLKGLLYPDLKLVISKIKTFLIF
jgi:hypothetical protein